MTMHYIYADHFDLHHGGCGDDVHASAYTSGHAEDKSPLNVLWH